MIVGSTTAFGVPTPQEQGGRAWTFAGWPAAGLPSRDVVTGPEDATYTAAFSTPADLGTPRVAAGRGRGAAGSDRAAGAPGVAARPGDGAAARRRAGGPGRARVRRGGRLRDCGARRPAAGDGVHGVGVGFGSRAARAAARSSWASRGRAFVLGVRNGTTRWRRGLRVDAGVRPRRWTRVALAWDGRRASVSVDGRVVASRAAGGSLGRVTRVRVGGDPVGGAWLRGRVARVTVTAG